MKNNFHLFRKNDKLKIQEFFIFVDTESKSTQITKEKELLTFKMGCSIFWDKISGNTFSNTFYEVSEFWNNIQAVSVKGIKNIIMFAHNTQFDFKMLDGFNQLFKRGWELTNHYVKNKTFILNFKHKENKTMLYIWDTMNYVPQSLKDLGKSVGLEKLEVEFDDVSDNDLEVYCKRDTEIIYKYIKKLVEFLETNNLSRLKATAGSLSFNTFRHRFYQPDIETRKIYIHDWKKAIALERESYHGGITDCFKLGTYNDLYKFDINSMYPYIMRDKPVPTKLVFYSHDSNYNQEQLFKLYRESVKAGYGVILKANITLDVDNAYILKDFGLKKTMFAYGSFDTVLCQPELMFLEKNGSINYIYEISIYEMEKLFDEFVTFFYEKRLEYKKSNDKVNEQFCKLMMNTQYGKWGQRNIVRRELTIDDKFMIENQKIISQMFLRFKEQHPEIDLKRDIAYLGTIIEGGELYVIAGQLILLQQTQDNSKESFVAISSFITSYARMMLVDFIKIANRDNLYYCDTDSLIVNLKGASKLFYTGLMNDTMLGKLKLEEFGQGSFYAPKFYDFNGKRKAKGIKKAGSILLQENKDKAVYQVQLWQKWKSDLKHNTLNNQLITTTTKQINKVYDKGKIDKYGVVIPYSVQEIEVLLSK